MCMAEMRSTTVSRAESSVVMTPRPGRPQQPGFLVNEMGPRSADESPLDAVETTLSPMLSSPSPSQSPSPPTTPPPGEQGSARGWDILKWRSRSFGRGKKSRDQSSGNCSDQSAGEGVAGGKADLLSKEKRSHSVSILDRIRKSSTGKRSRENHIVGHNGIGTRPTSPESDRKIHSRFCAQYRAIKVLGKGLYGVVYLCQELHGQKRKVAIKTVPAHLLIRTDCKKFMEQMIMERNTLRLIQQKPRDPLKNIEEITKDEESQSLLMNGPCPYLVQMYKAFHDSYYTFLVLECVKGGDMFTFLHERGRSKGLSADMTRVMAAEIACALEFLHLRDIVYRDLKPENVLLTIEGHTKLTDFGFCKSVFGHKRRTTHQVCGTLQYLSPECVWQAAHGQESDYWALGVLIHEMLTLKTPFDDAKDKYEVMSVITSGDIPIADEIYDESPEAYDLVSRMLDPRKSERIGWCHCERSMHNHCFFKSIQWDEVRMNRVEIPGWENEMCPDTGSASNSASNRSSGSFSTGTDLSGQGTDGELSPASFGDTDVESVSSDAENGAAPTFGVIAEYRKWAQQVGTEKERKLFEQTMIEKFDYPRNSKLGL